MYSDLSLSLAIYLHPTDRCARLDEIERLVAALGRRGDLRCELSRGCRRLEQQNIVV